MENSIATLRQDEWRTKRFLKKVVPVDKASKGIVGVAGSASLLWWQLKETNCNCNPGRLYIPGDIDVFVCGDDGKTHKNFSCFVRGILKKAAKCGYIVEKSTLKVNPHIVPDSSVHILDVWILGLRNKISFVQAPQDLSMKDIVRRFDISVSKVVYNIGSNRYIIPAAVKSNVEAQIASVASFCFLRSVPSNYERSRIGSVLARIKKCSGRGFEFIVYPNLGTTANTDELKPVPLELRRTDSTDQRTAHRMDMVCRRFFDVVKKNPPHWPCARRKSGFGWSISPSS